MEIPSCRALRGDKVNFEGKIAPKGLTAESTATGSPFDPVFAHVNDTVPSR